MAQTLDDILGGNTAPVRQTTQGPVDTVPVKKVAKDYDPTIFITNDIEAYPDNFKKFWKEVQETPELQDGYIFEAHRPQERATQLNKEYRAGTGGKAAKHSLHTQYMAFDLRFDSDEKYALAAQIAEKHGIGNPIKGDMGHFQVLEPVQESQRPEVTKKVSSLDDLLGGDASPVEPTMPGWLPQATEQAPQDPSKESIVDKLVPQSAMAVGDLVKGDLPAAAKRSTSLLSGAFQGLGGGLLEKGVEGINSALDPVMGSILQSLGISKTPADIRQPAYDMLAPANEYVAQAQEQYPTADLTGNIGSLMVGGNPIMKAGAEAEKLIPLMKKFPVLQKLLGTTVSGATVGAGVETASNPEATLGSTARSTAYGALIPAAIQGTGSAINKIGKGALDKQLKMEGASDILEKQGIEIASSRESLATKIQDVLSKDKVARDKILKSHSDITKKLGSIENAQVVPPKGINDKLLMELADDADSIPGNEMGDPLRTYSTKLKTSGFLNPLEANDLKMYIQKVVRTGGGKIRADGWSEGLAGENGKLAKAIEEVAEVKEVNAKMSSLLDVNKELKNLIKQSKKGSGGFDKVDVLLAFLTAGSSLPIQLGLKALKTVPGATATAAAGKSIASPAVSKAAQILTPSITKEK